MREKITDKFFGTKTNEIVEPERVFDYNVIFDKKLEKEIDRDLEKLRLDNKRLESEKEEKLEVYREEFEKFEREKERQLKNRIEKENIKRNLKKLDKEKVKLLKEEKRVKLEKLELKKKDLVESEKKLTNNIEGIDERIRYLENIFRHEQANLDKQRQIKEQLRNEIMGKENSYIGLPDTLPKRIRLVQTNAENQGYHKAKISLLHEKKKENKAKMNELNYKKEFFFDKHETIFQPTKVNDIYKNDNYLEMKNRIRQKSDTLDELVRKKEQEKKMQELENLKLRNKLLKIELDV